MKLKTIVGLVAVTAICSVGSADFVSVPVSDVLPEISSGCPNQIASLRKIGDEVAAVGESTVTVDGHLADEILVYGKNSSGKFDQGFRLYETHEIGPDGRIASTFQCEDLQSVH